MNGQASPGRIGVAVVGTGWGCLTHVPALRAAGFSVRWLVGTADERTRERAARHGVPNATVELAKALSDPDVHAVVVATPPMTHAGIVLQVIASGKHVVCEKPFALTVDEARRMRDAAVDRGVVHVVGHEFRWLPHLAATAGAVRSRLIGTPTLITHVRINGVLAGPEASVPEWFGRSDALGGWPNAEIQHVVDEIRLAAGEFACVTALEGQTTPHTWAAAETLQVAFTLANGAMGIIQTSIGAHGPMVNTQRISGTHGTVWTTPEGTVRLCDRQGERDIAPPPHLLGHVPTEQTTHDGSIGTNTLSAALSAASDRFSQPTRMLHEAFRDRIRGLDRTQWPPLPTFEDGLANTMVHAAVRESIASGAPSRLDGDPARPG